MSVLIRHTTHHRSVISSLISIRQPVQTQVRRPHCWSVSLALNRPGQVQYLISRQHCHLSQPAQKGRPHTSPNQKSFTATISFAWICTVGVTAACKPAKLNEDQWQRCSIQVSLLPNALIQKYLKCSHCSRWKKTTCTMSTLILLKLIHSTPSVWGGRGIKQK